ncbi:DUF2283 domain-containing protein [Propionibacteriaceae bacterium Y2011]
MITSSLQIDSSLGVAYLQLGERRPIAKTCEVAPGFTVDLDALGVVAGIEVLDLEATIPVERLKSVHHVDSRHIRILHRIAPTVTSFVARQSSHEPAVPVAARPEELLAALAWKSPSATAVGLGRANASAITR